LPIYPIGLPGSNRRPGTITDGRAPEGGAPEGGRGHFERKGRADTSHTGSAAFSQAS